jgi:hypothetical protein
MTIAGVVPPVLPLSGVPVFPVVLLLVSGVSELPLPFPVVVPVSGVAGVVCVFDVFPVVLDVFPVVLVVVSGVVWLEDVVPEVDPVSGVWIWMTGEFVCWDVACPVLFPLTMLDGLF